MTRWTRQERPGRPAPRASFLRSILLHGTSRPARADDQVRGFAGRAIFACVVLVHATDAFCGSGFQLRSQSATTLGTAQAGMSTAAEDPSTLIFNPALSAFFKASQWSFGATPIFSRGEFRPASASTILGTPIAGNDGGDSAKAGFPFNFSIASAVSDSVSVGFMATSLFGLGFKWDDGWVGRYHAGKSELLTFDFMPSLAYRPNANWALGAGINVRYAHAETRTAIDFGTLDLVSTGGVLGGIPSGNDGALRTRLQDWDVGYTLGVVFEPQEGTRIGLSYRSKTRMNLRGTSRFDAGSPVGQGLSALSGQFTDGDSNAPLELPAAAIIGLRHQLAKNWLLMADAQWTQWSALERLSLRFANPLQADIDTELHWRNSWFVALGLSHQFNPDWTLRAGVAYDETPSRHLTSTPAIPDARGVWLTLGAAYQVGRASKVDFAYGHIFVKDNPIALAASAPGNALRGNLTGKIRGSAVDFFSLQYSQAF